MPMLEPAIAMTMIQKPSFSGSIIPLASKAQATTSVVMICIATTKNNALLL